MSHRTLIHHDYQLRGLSMNKTLIDIMLFYAADAGGVFISEVWDGHEAMLYTFEADGITENLMVRVIVEEDPSEVTIKEHSREQLGTMLEWKMTRAFTWEGIPKKGIADA